MFAVIGLGNPGLRYEHTRHNAGFRVIAQLAKASETSLGKLNWQNKSGCSFTKTVFGKVSCLLILPQKFMILSGTASGPLLRFYNIEADKLIVVQDDLDLAPGTLRIRKGGAAAGHKGIADLISSLGNDDFVRVRLGIGHPRRQSEAAVPAAGAKLPEQFYSEGQVVSWVLGVPEGEDAKLLEQAEERAAAAIIMIMEQGLERAQQNFNRSM